MGGLENLKIEQHYRGPIPPASELEKLAQIDPTFPNRVMKMAENHNHANTKAREVLIKLGMWMIFVFFIASFSASVYFAFIGNNIVAGVFGLPPLVGCLKILFQKI